jgi:transposase
MMPREPLVVAGVDDRAYRRNCRYGTIVCDLERRRIVALLPDREKATVQAWLSERPTIKIVSRDRGGGYGVAVDKALPDAIQVADRWHLMENASAAFLDAVRRSMRGIRVAIGATTINPELLTCAESLRYQGYLRRRRRMQQLPLLSGTQSRSRKSSAGRATVVILSARSAAAAAPMCSGPPSKHARRPPAVPGCAMDQRLSQRHRALAA